MRTFLVNRGNDESGISGTGNVIEGTEFSDGTIVCRWLTEPSSKVHWDTFDDFWHICVNGHPSNETVVTFNDGTVLRQGEPINNDALSGEEMASLLAALLDAFLENT